MTPTRVYQITQSPLFKLELIRLERMRDQGVADVTQSLRELAPVALDTVEKIMYQAKSEKLRYTAACIVLDRAGYGAINKSDINVNAQVTSYASMPDEELKRLVQDRLERMKAEAEARATEEASVQAVEVEWQPAEAEEVVEGEDRSPDERPCPFGVQE
jgi:hypothetical protein